MSARDVPANYYSNIRTDIAPLLPDRLERVLEIGCASGVTLAHFKSRGTFGWIAGVEPVHEVALQAGNRLDMIFEGDIENMVLDIPEGSLDAILCLDVLEHLVDPWSVMKKLHPYLRPGGIVLASIPNVRFYKVILDLMLRGKWSYVSDGIMDRTHLRFFTLSSAIELIESAGLRMDGVLKKGVERNKGRGRTNRLTFRVFEDLLTYHYLLRARKL